MTLKPKTRLFLDAIYTKGTDQATLELAGYLDISIKPIVKKLQRDDWQRSRYFWARIGYDHAFTNFGSAGAGADENRGIISFYGKTFLPAEAWAEFRVRSDLRWIGDDYSTRYRLRAEVDREFTVLDHAVVPYFNVEWFYDTRYDGWARTLYLLAAEVTVSTRFRYEINLARQSDRLPRESDVNVLAILLKWYY